MNDLTNLVVHLGKLNSGKWIAATAHSPYFCVEAETEEAVKILASDALRFYCRASDVTQNATPPFTSTVMAKELVAA